MNWGPHDTFPEEIVLRVDELAALSTKDSFDKLRERYTMDDAIRVPADITSFIDGKPTAVHLEH